MTALDKRLNAVRPDLADIALKSVFSAERYVDGVAARCIVPAAGVHRAPAPDAMQVTQMLWGESAQVFERANGWAWVQLSRDRYVGYVREDALTADVLTDTHKVSVPLTHVYPAPDIKTQPAIAIPMNAILHATGITGAFLTLAGGGHVYAYHAMGKTPEDFVAVAEQFLHTPYLWGGRSVFGIDCSGLVQSSLQACGIEAPRDSDMQENELGEPVSGPLQRGDLVFWKGHVGIMRDASTLLHANGHHMMVVSEPYSLAVERSLAKGLQVTAVKRLQ